MIEDMKSQDFVTACAALILVVHVAEAADALAQNVAEIEVLLFLVTVQMMISLNTIVKQYAP